MTMRLPVEYPVEGQTPAYSGKVREIYDLGREMIIVATDRLSTYDVILPDRIPDKGKILTRLSTYWFSGLSTFVPTHFLTADLDGFPRPFRSAPSLAGRAMLVRKARRLDVECIVRGYLAGSGLKEYRAGGSVCGVRLPDGLAPSFYGFLGKLKKVVKRVARRAVRADASAVGAAAEPRLGPVLEKLKALVKPLLRRAIRSPLG